MSNNLNLRISTKPKKPKLNFALHAVQVVVKVLHYEEDGFYLIRMYEKDSMVVIHTDAYFTPSDSLEDMMNEAEDFRERIDNYDTPWHVYGEIEYVKRS